MAPGWNRPAALLAAMVAAASAGCDVILGIEEATLDPTLTGTGGGSGSSTATAGGMGGAGGAGTAGETSSAGGAGGSGGSGGSGGVSGCPSLEGPALIPITAFGQSYCIDATEVSKGHYKTWLDSIPGIDAQPPQCAWNTTFEPTDPDWPTIQTTDPLPVTHVNWCDAYAYCAGVGKRLCGKIGGGPNAHDDYDEPTRSAWLNACSHEGMNDYPYGGTYVANVCNGMDYPGMVTINVGSAAGCVGGYPGIHDMSGNVWEWEDSCSADLGETDTCRRRGGSYLSNATLVRCLVGEVEARNARLGYIGFRCCLD